MASTGEPRELHVGARRARTPPIVFGHDQRASRFERLVQVQMRQRFRRQDEQSRTGGQFCVGPQELARYAANVSAYASGGMKYAGAQRLHGIDARELCTPAALEQLALQCPRAIGQR